MRPGIPYRIAHGLLKFAHRLAPPRSREWGDAMLVEIEFIDGPGQILAWSAGSASVLLKETFLELLIPRRAGSGPELSPLNSKEGTMRKVALVLCACSILTFLGLLLAPTFRQALNVSASGWRAAFGQHLISAAGIGRLVEQSRLDRDPETMAFAAMHLPPGDKSLQLANEAVKLNPNLTWVYFVLAQKMDPGPVSDDLIGRVQAWDPDNAVPRLAAADAMRGLPKQVDLVMDPRADLPRPWLQRMDAAFAATKYDNYFASRLDLERSVILRRKLKDPILVVDAISSRPMPNILLLRGYARHVLAVSQQEEAAGQVDQAWQSCWAVARFGHLLSLQAHSYFERFIGPSLQLDAFERLQVLAEKKHNREAVALIAAQVEELKLFQHLVSTDTNGVWRSSYLSASVSQAASLGALISLGVLTAVSMIWLVGRLLHGPAAPRESRVLGIGAIAGAVGLAVPSLTIYLYYKPFADVFSHFLKSSGLEGVEPFISFYGFADIDIPYLPRRMFDPYLFPWYLLLSAAAVLMLVELSRIIRGSPKPTIAK